MKIIINLILNTISVAISAYLVPGVSIDTWFSALTVSVVLGLINTLIKPIITILTLPITILTLGFFYIIINVAIIYVVDYLIQGFTIAGFIPAIIFSFVLSIVSWFIGKFK